MSTDDPTTETPTTDAATATAEGAPSAEGQAGDAPTAAIPEAPARLEQTVAVRDAGPCRKHVTVTVDRKAIDERFDEKYTELVRDSHAAVSGFRPGKAPRRLIERRHQKEVGEQVKGELLMASLEQVAEETQLAAISAPDIDPSKIVIPKEGPLVYEFEVEVRPEFTLPNYKGLPLRRPVKTFSDAEVLVEERRLLEQYGQIVPKAGPAEGQPPVVEVGDHIVADLRVHLGDRELNAQKEAEIRVTSRLAFNDGVAERFGELIHGAKIGESRDVDLKLSENVANQDLRGQTATATFTVKDIKTIRLPEVTHELMHEFGVHSIEQLRELIRAVLERRLQYAQRQSARQQVMSLISDASNWDLPRDMLIRQSRKALARRIMEMRSSGISEEEIAGRQRILEQDVLKSTAQALKEHFVLQKVAELEKIEVEDSDIDAEIERMAERADESPRRVRARLEKEDMLDTLAADLLERKALDLILESAVYQDVPIGAAEEPAPVGAVEAQAVPGEPPALEPEAPAAVAAGSPAAEGERGASTP